MTLEYLELLEDMEEMKSETTRRKLQRSFKSNT